MTQPGASAGRVPGVAGLRGILGNRWALLGLAGAAVIGGVVWYRNRSATTATGTASTGTSSAPAPGTFDSTATDVAATLGNYDALLGQYQQQLSTTEQALAAARPPAPGVPANPIPAPPRQPSYRAKPTPGRVVAMSVAPRRHTGRGKPVHVRVKAIPNVVPREQVYSI